MAQRRVEAAELARRKAQWDQGDLHPHPVGPGGRRYPGEVAVRFVIIGGGPAGNTAATYAARFGAEVTLVEKDVIGGAAHLWDCIPSKAMIASGGAMSFARRIPGMGLDSLDPVADLDALRTRNLEIERHLETSVRTLLTSQGVRLLHGTARLKGAHEVVVDTADGITELEADAVLLSTGSRPRIPAWA